MQQIKNGSKNKKTLKLEALLICKTKLVRQCDLRWNQVEVSTLLVYQKLRNLGFTYEDGQIIRPDCDEH